MGCCGAAGTVTQNHLKGAYVIETDWVMCRVNIFGPLTIGQTNYGNVRPGILIKVHREMLEEASQYVTPKLPTSGRKIEGPRSRFAFWPDDSRGGYLATGTRVEPWRFYYLPIALAETATFPFEEVPYDQSRVGTRLKSHFERLGFKEKPNCSCKKIRRMMDDASLDFLANHRDKIVSRIVESAKAQDVTMPGIGMAINRLYGVALWQERRRCGLTNPN